MKRSILILAVALVQGLAHAQAWPSRAIRVVVPVGAGSSTDIVHRLVLERLSIELGQPIVVENRVGAGGTIGTALVARAEPDGYTLLANGAAHTIAPALYKSLPYDPVRDFAPVVPVGGSPSVLVVAPARGLGTVEMLVAAAKAHPGTLNFSSVGVGTATHLSAERFASSAGIDVVHVPFKGGAEAMLEVLAGRVDFFFGPVALVLPHVREGKLLALAVNSPRRSAVLSQVRTLEQAGYREADYPIWFGIFAPSRTPRAVLEALNRATMRALQAPALRERLASLGVEPMAMSAEEFRAYVDNEFLVNAGLAKKAGLKAQ